MNSPTASQNIHQQRKRHHNEDHKTGLGVGVGGVGVGGGGSKFWAGSDFLPHNISFMEGTWGTITKLPAWRIC